jgi:hypothetical protein
MKGPWVKLYRSFIADPTIQFLIKTNGHEIVTILVTLLCDACDGVCKKQDDELSFICQLEESEFKRLIDIVASRGIIKRDISNNIYFVNWLRYQENSSTERMRKKRIQDKNVTVCDVNVTGRSRGEKIEDRMIDINMHPLVEGAMSNILTRIEKVRQIWNGYGSSIGPECRMIFNSEKLREFADIVKAYSDEEIAEAICNYKNIRESPEYEVSAPYRSFAGFIRGGVEKFVSTADPFTAYKKRVSGFENAEERARREAEEYFKRSEK